MNKFIVLITAFSLFISCSELSSTRELSGEELANAYCSSCHLYPAPHLLPKEQWHNVLTPMGARLGMSDDNYNPYKGKTMEEIFEIDHAGLFPSQPMLSDDDWKRLKTYILNLAPDTLSSLPLSNSKPQQLFTEHLPDINLQGFPVVTLLEFDQKNELLYLSDWNGHLIAINSNFELDQYTQLPSPIVDIIPYPDQLQLLSIGKLYPNELKNGALVTVETDDFDRQQVNIVKLGRPVYVENSDLNNDNLEDIVICSFGNLVGQLAWYENTGESYTEHVLKAVPGATRTYIQDFDQNGFKDIMVLFAQGDEGISIFYNSSSGFTEKRILRFNPLHGSNDFELVDFDKDGDLDLIMTNGDNGDYSNTLKPYHGVRIFVNNGDFEFTERYFYPQHGAAKVRARDFDLDGDIDLLIASFFPDYIQSPSQSILLLEQINPYQFQPYHFENASKGRWMVMDAGDLDGDQDIDLAIGSFVLDSQGIPDSLLTQWRSNSNHFLFLENKTNN